MKHSLRNTALAALVCFAATGALAAGNHASGHGGDANDAVGKPGIAAKNTRTINVEMTDSMRFSPADISVKQGQTVRFVVKNAGQLRHELVLGTPQDLKAHYEIMKNNPEMEHADANMITLAAGKSGEIVWQFTKAGKVDFGCLQSGHYDAGMKGAVRVTKSAAT